MAAKRLSPQILLKTAGVPLNCITLPRNAVSAEYAEKKESRSMPMTPMEVMRAAIRFQTPDRLPVQMRTLLYSDTSGVGFGQDSQKARTGEGLDEWGCRWEKTEMANMGQPVGHPLTDYRAVEDYPFPDPLLPEIYEEIARELEVAEKDTKYVTVDQFMMLFERMHSLMGLKRILEGLYVEPEAMALLADRLVEYDITKINRAGELFGDRIHCFGGTDDWGTQQALFISPEKWREFFLPRYKKIFDAAHAWGWDTQLHSCGRVNDAIPLLTEAGLNMINLQQPRALGIEDVGAKYAGTICFESLCDIQHTLPAGDAKAINDEAELLLAHWSTPKGGFVLSDYGDPAAIGVPPETKEIMLKAFLTRDPYIAPTRKHPAFAVAR